MAAAALAGCGSAGHADAPAGTSAAIGERDFKISAPATVRAGEVDLAVANKGPVAHELIVVRGSARDLPMRSDGLSVDEDRVENKTAGALEPQAAGVHHLAVSLDPGRYVVFCNMAGHFSGGMHQEIAVR
jgi:uncharacterized cupredoxin-like copper-binding protein